MEFTRQLAGFVHDTDYSMLDQASIQLSKEHIFDTINGRGKQ